MSANTDFLEEANAEFAAEIAKDQSATESTSTEIPTVSEPEEDVPSFLDVQDHGDTDEQLLGDVEDVQTETPQAPSSEDGTLTYTANGKEFSATLEDAKKALSMMKGARRAFSDRAKLKREVASLKKDAEDGAQFKKYWEEIMAKSKNPKEAWEALTGQSFDQVLENELQRRQLYANATDEQKQMFEYEDRFNEMQSKLTRFEDEAARKQRELSEKASDARKQHLSGLMEPVFFEHSEKFESMGLSKAELNDVNDMLWNKSIRDMKKAINAGYKPNRAVVKKIFDRNARILLRDNKDQVDQGVKQELARKREDAKTKAQVASTQNYSGPLNMNDLVKKNPKDLFELFKRGK